MGISGGPNMVEDGLVLLLDANSTYLPVNRNLLSYTNDLTNASWSKVRSQITANAATAPDGTNTAFAMSITDATGLVRLSQISINTSIIGGPYTFSVYVKQNNISASLFDTGVLNASSMIGSEPSYDILNNFNVTGGNGTYVSNRTVTSVGNGWYRVATTATIPDTNSWYLFFDIEAGSGTKINGQSLYLWGPQFEYGTIATEYQPVNVTTRVWPNQINSSINGSLINNPTFNSSNGGSINFDGTNDYITFGDVSIGTSTTMLFWISGSFQNRYLGIHSRRLPDNQNIETGTGLNVPIPNNGWVQVGYQGNTGGTNNFIINGVIYAGNTGGRYTYNSVDDRVLFGLDPSPFSGNDKQYTTFTIQSSAGGVTGYVWADRGQKLLGVLSAQSVQRYLLGSIGNFQVYNRVLTSSEILQNYNSQKSRFNL